MKPKNFPARKLRRQMEAEYQKTGDASVFDDKKLQQARNVRTKKSRKS